MLDRRSDDDVKGEPQSSSGAASSDSFALQVPAISPPKGGRAIRGISEEFTANSVTGTESTSIPINTSPGRAGGSPKLALSSGKEVVVVRMSAEPKSRGGTDPDEQQE